MLAKRTKGTLSIRDASYKGEVAILATQYSMYHHHHQYNIYEYLIIIIITDIYVQKFNHLLDRHSHNMCLFLSNGRHNVLRNTMCS